MQQALEIKNARLNFGDSSFVNNAAQQRWHWQKDSEQMLQW